MRIPSCTLVLVPLLLACDREPIAPDIASPLFAATHGEIVLEGYDDMRGFVSCANDGLGEWLHHSGPYRLTIRTAMSNSGNLLWKWSHVEYLEGYEVRGETSGDLWTILPDESRANNQRHFQKNGNFVANGVWVEWYENQDGDRMLIRANLQWHFVNGEWRIWRVGLTSCA
jgi:hypothetical protein